MLDTRQLLTLIHVAEEGTLAGAARRLGYTASAVSQQMAALEADAGVPLFERRAQSIRLTPTAHAIVGRARGIRDALEALESEIAAISTGLAHLLRVGTFPSAAGLALPLMLSKLRAAVPGLSVTLDEGEPDELVARVEDGGLDAALVYRYGLEPLSLPNALASRELFVERLFLIGPAGAFASTDASSLAALGDLTWISPRDGSPGSRSLSRMFARAGIAPMVPVRSNNHGMVRALVESGEGVSIVPELGLTGPFSGDVRRLVGEGAHRAVLLVSRRSDASRALDAFAHAAAQAFLGLERTFEGAPTCDVEA